MQDTLIDIYVLWAISYDNTRSGKTISKKVLETDRTIRMDIADLQAKGILTREGGHKDGRWVITKK